MGIVGRDVRPCAWSTGWLTLKVIRGGCVMASSHDSLVKSRPRELWAGNLRVLLIMLVAIAGVAACYMAGYALTRAPGIAKVL